MTKNEFKGYLLFIKQKRDDEDGFVKALEKLSPSCYCDCFLYDQYEDKMINLLEEVMQDTSHEISYFIYDMNGLDHLDESRCPKDAEGKILYNSIDTLYDYLGDELNGH